MPIYEYYCSKCKELFEELVMKPGTEKAACPKCNQRKHTRRCMSSVSIRKTSSNAGYSTKETACSPGSFS